MVRNFQVLLLLMGLLATVSAEAVQHGERIIAGWLETVVLSPWQLKLTAKLDSGAKTSSIHADNIEHFEREGKTWVRFDLPRGRNEKAMQRSIEVPLLRDVRIKRHKLPPVTRSVVEMSFCIDSHIYTTQFTLADRGNFNYPVLLGRRFLKDNILIDPAETFLHRVNVSEVFCSHSRGHVKGE